LLHASLTTAKKMASEHPKLRDDLIITQLGDAGETSFVVKDPVTRRFFRLQTTEAFIAAHLDGRTTVEDIRSEFERELGAPLPRDRIERFLDRLEKLCLLDDPDGERRERDVSRAQRDAALERDGRGRLLYIKLKTLDPNRFFDAIAPRLAFFFTRGFFWTVIFLAAVAIGIVISNWSDYTAQTKSLITAGSIPAFILVAVVVGGLHELAHGIACKHFGGNVHELGFILIYFLPAFYCNVSDAWLLPDKKKRLWVSFAGVFFQAFVWAIAAILWRVADQETKLSGLCCIAIGTTGLSTLFNLSPLLKLDGYYLLVDQLGIPNLRRKAFDYLKSGLTSWVRPAALETKSLTTRERRVYWWYGVTAGVYSIGVLGFVLWKGVEFLFSSFQGTGVVFFGGAAFIALTGSFERLTSGVGSVIKQGTSLHGKRRRPLAVLGILLIALAVVIFGRWELKVSNKAQLLSSSRASVRTEVEGTIREIFVGEGDTVSARAPIAALDDTEYRAEMDKTGAEIAKWTAELELLEKGPLAEEVTRLEKLIDKEKTKVAFAEKEFERTRELSEKNIVSPKQFEEASETLDVARKDLETAESELDVLLAGSRPEKIRSAKAEIDRLRSAYEFYRELVARTRIESPIEGVVATHHLKDKVGEFFESGDEVCQIVDSRTMLVEIPVSEKDVTEVEIGQRVKFRARSIPKIAFHGSVVSVAPVAGKNTDRTVVIVTSRLDNPDLLLRSGMTGNAKIYCGKRRIIDLWTRKVIRFIRVEFWW
jgi:putative peptide zinc metalloprotease protein